MSRPSGFETRCHPPTDRPQSPSTTPRTSEVEMSRVSTPGSRPVMKSHLIPVKDESGVWDSGILGLQEVPADASGNDLPGVQERRWNQAVPETVEDTGRGRRPLGLRAAASCSQPIRAAGIRHQHHPAGPAQRMGGQRESGWFRTPFARRQQRHPCGRLGRAIRFRCDWLNLKLVRKGGLEPPRYCYRQPLKLVRLPIPPLPRAGEIWIWRA